MNELLAIVSSRTLANLAFALLHSLWQATLLAGLLWVVLRLIPARMANLRYGLGLAAMFAVVIAAMATFSICDRSSVSTLAPGGANTISADADSPSQEKAVGGAAVSGSSDGAAIRANGSTIDSTPAGAARPVVQKGTAWENWAMWLVLAWVTGVMLTLVRVVLSLRGAAGLRRLVQPVVDPALDAMVKQLGDKLGLARRVAVAVCDKVTSPSVIGVILPVILLPPSALSGMPVEQLRAIIAHELAHVRRCDWLVNVLQMIVEAMGFFNPAVWWISRQIRVEREACCDAAAAAAIGMPGNMAQALVDWCHRAKGMQVAMALADETTSPLADRVKRLLIPGYRPSARVPWYTFAILLVAAAVVMAFLAKSTSLAVEAAAKVLTPQQRVEKLAEASRKYGPGVVARDTDQTDISLLVRTADGGKLKRVYCTTYSSSGNSSGLSGFYVGNDGRFEGQVRSGSLWISTKTEGYAPSWIGPLQAVPGGKLDKLEIVLKRGYESRIQCVEESGTPIAGVKLTATVMVSSWNASAGESTSGPDGMAVLPHLSDTEHNLHAECDGYEPADRSKVRFKPGEVIKWKLKKAQPLNGLIVDDLGRPVSGASVRLFSNGVHVNGNFGKVLATSDAQGRFKATTLNANMANVLYIEHPQLGRQLVRNVKVSSEVLRIVMAPLTVRGRIIGDLKKLKTGPGGVPSVKYGITVMYVNDGAFGFGVEPDVPVAVKDGQGRFEIHGLPPCTLRVTAGNVTESLKVVAGSQQEMVINLVDKKLIKRKVVLKLLPPQGQPLPTGSIELHSYLGEQEPIVEQFELVNAEASIEAYVGGRFVYHPKRIVGAWLPEGDLAVVPQGEGPLVVTRQTYPAGAIVGRVLDERGKAVHGDARVQLYVKERPRGPAGESVNWSTLHNTEADINPSDGTFMITPVPFGGVYSVVVSRGKYYVASGPVTVDAANPMPKVELRTGKGATMGLRVVGPDGKAMAGVPVTFEYTLKNAGSGTWSQPIKTDAQGMARFDDINIDAGTYFGKVEMPRDYQPELVPLAPVKYATVVKLERGLVLEGRVVDDATGWPIPNAEVRAVPEKMQPGRWFDYKAEDKTDKDGHFRISTLSNQSFGIRVNEANIADAKQRNYQPGKEGLIELRVTLPAWSKLRPRKAD